MLIEIRDIRMNINKDNELINENNNNSSKMIKTITITNECKIIEKNISRMNFNPTYLTKLL